MQELVWLDQATAAIERVATIGEAKEIADKAAAVKVYAAKAGWGEREKVRVAEIETRARVRMGELLLVMDKAKGAWGQLRGKDSSGAARREAPEDAVPKLSDLGVTHKQAHVAQLAAKVSKDDREKYFAECRDDGKRLATATGLAQSAKPVTERPYSLARLMKSICRAVAVALKGCSSKRDRVEMCESISRVLIAVLDRDDEDATG